MSELPPSGQPLPVRARGEPVSWLVRPATIRGLWVALAVVLAALLGAQAVFGHGGEEGLAGTFGFAAWYGFGACAALVIVAKTLALILKRPDSYYDD